MIAVTRLNGSRFAVNPDLIERVQESPDTTLVMVGGTTYVVRESLPEMITLIAEFRALVLATAHAYAPDDPPRLTVLPGAAGSGPVPEPTAAPAPVPPPTLLRAPEREGAP